MITQAQKDQIQEYFSTQPVDAVYLFGSQAKGRTTKLSDTDFAILFNPAIDSEKRFDLKLEYIGELSHVMKSDEIDVLDLNQAPLRLAYEAIRPKVTLCINDKNQQVFFESTTTKKYFDFQPRYHAIAMRQLEIIAKHGLMYDPRPN